MHCHACHAPLSDAARFCTQCGAPAQAPTGAHFAAHFGCTRCGGDGARLPAGDDYCPECRWLRPLCPGYELPLDAFLWRLDADAMHVLRSLGPLTSAAHALSERVGRAWFEASVNGLRLGPKQLPDVFRLAIRAARIVGLPSLPEIYLSGDQMWEASTLGTDHDAFIVIGSVLLNFKDEDMLFILAREMGHCRAGHALWRTVSQFVAGRSHKRSIAGDGVMGLINPAKLIENAVDAPLMAWARQAEITADCAGLLAVGSERVARRVLQGWTFRSFPLLQQIDQDAWLEQEADSDAAMTQVAEWTLSSTPYLAGRLRLLREYADSDLVKHWRARIVPHLAPMKTSSPATTGGGAATGTARPATGAPVAPTTQAAPTVRLVCAACNEPMRVPQSLLATGKPVNVRCPNMKCRSVLTVRPKAAPPAGAAAAASAQTPAEA